MGLFGKQKSQSYLGIDIGTGGVKLVELANEKGRARLMTYAFTERRSATGAASLLDDPKKAAALLQRLIKESGATATRAVSGLPQHNVFDAIISIPRTKEQKDRKALIEAQVRKLTPIPFEEMILDSKILDEEKKDLEYTRVLVTGAPKMIVQKYIEIFRLAKLQLLALETESFALVRSLVGKDRSTIMTIDIGSHRTNLSVIEKGIPLLSRSLNVGGALVSEQIAQQMGVEREEAEQMKIDLAKAGNAEVPPAAEIILQPILNEINYTFRILSERGVGSANVEKVILTGGSSALPGLVPYLTQKLNLNVYLGDPFARVAVPQTLRPVLDDVGPRFAVALGLAMRDIE